MPPDVLIHGDTLRSAPLRYELPLGILDPFSYFELNGRRVAVISSMEAGRVAEAAPGVEVIDPYELGLDELIARGMRWDELEPELCARAAERLGVSRLVVPGELPVAVADRLRADGVEVVPDEREFIQRRRSKTAAEIAGVRRAQAAADAGAHGRRRAAARRRAGHRRGGARASARSPPSTARRPGGHHRGAGRRHRTRAGHRPAPAGRADHHRHLAARRAVRLLHRHDPHVVTGGEADVAAWHSLCEEALQRVYALLRPGVKGQDLFAARATCSRMPASRPSARSPRASRRDGSSIRRGTGSAAGARGAVPGRTGADELVAGDVVAIEPGCYRHGYGGVRLEDLALVTEDGYERLTNFPYALEP